MLMDSSSEILLCILDLNFEWWQNNTKGISLQQFIDSIHTFVNSYLSLSTGKEIVLIASTLDSNFYIYPNRTEEENSLSSYGKSLITSPNNRWEELNQINSICQRSLRKLWQQFQTSDKLGNKSQYASSFVHLAGGLAMALCYSNSRKITSDVKRRRVLIFKSSADNPLDFMRFMNCAFTCQNLSIKVDVCCLDNSSGVLEQVSRLTNGFYYDLPTCKGLVENLLWLFLDSTIARPNLKKAVDLKTACFCHHRMIDIGYVCSVCLSVFCTFNAICPTCKTTFSLPANASRASLLSRKT